MDSTVINVIVLLASIALIFAESPVQLDERHFRTPEGQEEAGNGWQDSVPGLPGRDYPNLTNIPETSFTCKDKTPGGYYADVETRCQVFHVCSTQGAKSSFLCPSGSIFNQRHFVCDWWYDFECEQAIELYSLNKALDDPESSTDQLTDDRYSPIPPVQYNSLSGSNSDLSLASSGYSNNIRDEANYVYEDYTTTKNQYANANPSKEKSLTSGSNYNHHHHHQQFGSSTTASGISSTEANRASPDNYSSARRQESERLKDHETDYYHGENDSRIHNYEEKQHQQQSKHSSTIYRRRPSLGPDNVPRGFSKSHLEYQAREIKDRQLKQNDHAPGFFINNGLSDEFENQKNNPLPRENNYVVNKEYRNNNNNYNHSNNNSNNNNYNNIISNHNNYNYDNINSNNNNYKNNNVNSNNNNYKNNNVNSNNNNYKNNINSNNNNYNSNNFNSNNNNYKNNINSNNNNYNNNNINSNTNNNNINNNNYNINSHTDYKNNIDKLNYNSDNNNNNNNYNANNNIKDNRNENVYQNSQNYPLPQENNHYINENYTNISERNNVNSNDEDTNNYYNKISIYSSSHYSNKNNAKYETYYKKSEGAEFNSKKSNSSEEQYENSFEASTIIPRISSSSPSEDEDDRQRQREVDSADLKRKIPQQRQEYTTSNFIIREAPMTTTTWRDDLYTSSTGSQSPPYPPEKTYVTSYLSRPVEVTTPVITNDKQHRKGKKEHLGRKPTGGLPSGTGNGLPGVNKILIGSNSVTGKPNSNSNADENVSGRWNDPETTFSPLREYTNSEYETGRYTGQSWNNDEGRYTTRY